MDQSDYEKSVELGSRILDSYSDKKGDLRLVAVAKYNLSLIYKDRKEYAKSLELLNESDRYLSKALQLAPDSPDLLSDYATGLWTRALLLAAMGRPEKARKVWADALRAARQVVDANPKVTRFDWLLADALKDYAGFLSSRGDYDAARAAYQDAVGILQDITQRVDDRPNYGAALVEVLDSLAWFQAGAKGSLKRNDKAYRAAVDNMLHTAERFAAKYPESRTAQFELVKAYKRQALFKEEIEKNDEAAFGFYSKALKTFSDKVYSGEESPNSFKVSYFLQEVVQRAAQSAERLHNIDEVHWILQLAYPIGKTHTGTDGVEGLASTFGSYANMLKKAGRYPEAIKANRTKLELAEPVWQKAKWHYYLRVNIAAAYLNLAVLYQQTGDLANEVEARQAWLRLWAIPQYSIDPDSLLEIEPTRASADQVRRLRELTGKKYATKRFTIPVDFNGITMPFYVFITNSSWPKDPLKDQARWLEEERGGKIPERIRESFRKLHKIAHENNVSFPDLVVYALGSAAEEKTRNSRKKITKSR